MVNFHRLGLVARDLEEPQRGHPDFIASRLRDFETQTDVALAGQMINFRGPHFRKNPPQSGSIGKIAIMQEEAFIVDVFVAPQMFDARAQEIARAPNDSMNGVPFSEKQFRQVGTILAGDAGDERSLWISIHRLFVQHQSAKALAGTRTNPGCLLRPPPEIRFRPRLDRRSFVRRFVARLRGSRHEITLLAFSLALGGALVIATAIPAPGEQPAPLPFFKGVTVSCQTWGIEWQTPEMEATLDELKSLGVNSIAIHPYAQIREDGHVVDRAPVERAAPPTSRSRCAGRTNAACRPCSFRTSPIGARSFRWRGEINFATPEEWNIFFTEYETWIVQMATLAEAEHAEVFCVGLEFSFAQKYDERWRKIIAAVRAVYHGKVTYGANWNEYAEVKFWDALDYIGVLAYFPLTKTPNPSASELAAAWEKRCAELEKYSKQHGKQFLFVEIGYNESARTAAEPWAFKTGGEHAAEIQARCIDVALGLPAKHPFIAGMYWWKWLPGDPAPRRGKLPVADRADQSADREILES